MSFHFFPAPMAPAPANVLGWKGEGQTPGAQARNQGTREDKRRMKRCEKISLSLSLPSPSGRFSGANVLSSFFCFSAFPVRKFGTLPNEHAEVRRFKARRLKEKNCRVREQAKQIQQSHTFYTQSARDNKIGQVSNCRQWVKYASVH